MDSPNQSITQKIEHYRQEHGLCKSFSYRDPFWSWLYACRLERNCWADFIEKNNAYLVMLNAILILVKEMF